MSRTARLCPLVTRTLRSPSRCSMFLLNRPLLQMCNHRSPPYKEERIWKDARLLLEFSTLYPQIPTTPQLVHIYIHMYIVYDVKLTNDRGWQKNLEWTHLDFSFDTVAALICSKCKGQVNLTGTIPYIIFLHMEGVKSTWSFGFFWEGVKWAVHVYPTVIDLPLCWTLVGFFLRKRTGFRMFLVLLDCI